MIIIPNHPSQLEPYTLNERALAPLRQEAFDLVAADAALPAQVHIITQRAVANLVRGMNCFYSNLIEGHKTLPLDIERAMRHDFSTDRRNRDRQLFAAAHLETEQDVEVWLRQGADPWTPEFLLRIHERYCSALPPEMLQLPDGSVMVPGQWRNQYVTVGEHVPPEPGSIPRFLDRFTEAQHAVRGREARMLNAIAGHHRLAWIHPFADCNGRVIRIATDAQMNALGIKAGALWSWSRGLAKADVQYKSALANADQPRLGNYDGRGNLSTKALMAFTKFGLGVAVDQAKFMTSMLQFDGLKQRVEAHFVRERADLRPASARMVIEAVIHGEIARKDAQRVSGLKERTARDTLGQLLRDGYLQSDSPKGLLRAAFPTHALGSFFPNLYPKGSLDATRDESPNPAATAVAARLNVQKLPSGPTRRTLSKRKSPT
jgi:Fic family protein